MRLVGRRPWRRLGWINPHGSNQPSRKAAANNHGTDGYQDRFAAEIHTHSMPPWCINRRLRYVQAVDHLVRKTLEEPRRRRLMSFQSQHFLQLALFVMVGIHNYFR